MLAAETRAATARANQVFELPIAWRQIVEPVEPFLGAVARRLAGEVREFDGGLVPYAEYALTGQGKHLRSALVGLSANATGKITEAHITVAVIIEMVHLATLVHDDVVDEAEIRRGQLTLAANWGNETAVLFGDCLFAQALKLAGSFPTPEICRAVAAATKTVCSGEILQNQQRHNFPLSRRDYFRVLEMKTAELFALSCDLGALLNGATAACRTALWRFGLALGTAYQIYDDCLDLFGSEAVAGKSLGTDLAKGKLTLPLLICWERATSAERTKLEVLVQNWRPGSIAEVVSLLKDGDALGKSLEIFDRYLEAARGALKGLPEGRAGLLGLTDYLGRQAESLTACA
jgi:octaprenyl-diphosphate synthase